MFGYNAITPHFWRAKGKHTAIIAKCDIHIFQNSNLEINELTAINVKLKSYFKWDVLLKLCSLFTKDFYNFTAIIEVILTILLNQGDLLSSDKGKTITKFHLNDNSTGHRATEFW